MSHDPSQLQSGDRVGEFEIVREVARGGMGIVYEALQASLDRSVALKILPPGLGMTPQAVSRFEREARAAARLQHPNIVSVHAVGMHEGLRYYVMDLIDGHPLDRILNDLRNGRHNEMLHAAIRARSSGQGLPIPERIDPSSEAWFDLACQLTAEVASALDYAHGVGVIHRDVKPGNLLLSRHGRLCLTDFGLARVAADSRVTQSGVVVGTPAYMSPEQMSPENALLDHRSDIYSLGAVLYEMLTLRPPFAAELDAGVVVDARVQPPRPPRVLEPRVPPAVEDICLKALEKEPAERFQSGASMAAQLALAGHAGAGHSAVRTMSDPRWRSAQPRWLGGWVPSGVGLLFAIAAVVVAWMFLQDRPPARPLPDWMPRQLTTDPGWEDEPALSPDGTLVAYVSDRAGTRDIWVVDVQGGKSVRVTSGSSPASSPTWFPDGSWLAYESTGESSTDIWRVPRFGGPPVLMIENGHEPAISPDGKYVAFSTEFDEGFSQIAVAPLDDPTKRTAITGHVREGWPALERPAWSPDGKWICYEDFDNLWIVSATGGTPRRLTPDATSTRDRNWWPAWSSDGRSIYYTSSREGTVALWRVGIDGSDLTRLTLGTGPETQPSVSSDGSRLAYSTRKSNPDVVILDLSTREEVHLPGLTIESGPVFSRTGDRVIFTSGYGGKYELWVQLLDQGQPVGDPWQLTRHAGSGSAALPRISPDGRWVVYWRIFEGRRDIWIVPADGGSPRPLTDDEAIDLHPSFSPDGTRIAFSSSRDGTSDIWIAAVDRDGRAGDLERVTSGKTDQWWPEWSPDGKQIAFVHATDDSEVFVVQLGAPQPPRALTRGAHARMARWIAPDELAVLGSWGGDAWELKRVPLSGGTPSSFDPPVVFDEDATPQFDISSDQRWLTYTEGSMRGDIWVLEAQLGAF